MKHEKSLVERAAVFAAEAHKDHKRKYTGEPYFLHLEEVADLVHRTGAADEAVAAAWLHDTIEDVGVTGTEIASKFGPRVEALVWILTDPPKSFGNRAIRKALTRTKLAAADGDAHTIKLADMLSNGKSIFEHDPKFAKVYLREMRDLLKVLTKGNATLRAKVAAMLNNEGN